MILAAVLLVLTASTAIHAADFESIPDVVYGHKMGMALTFDVLKPSGNPNGAGVLFMVSGGWFSRWAPVERSAVRFAPLLEKGFTVFAVRHGSAPLFKVPDAVADVRRAVRFIRLHASEYGVDPERLGVWGGSAGGHLSLMLGTAADDGEAEATDPVLRQSSRVAAVVAYFPPVDLRGLTGPNERFPALDFDATKAESISPIVHVSRDDPPSLLIHGDQDSLVPLTHSTRIHKAFQDAEVTTDLVVIEGAEHGFRGEDAEVAGKAMVSWFARHLAGD